MMKFDDFLEALDRAGWEGIHDAQHRHIKLLWAKMYPVIAELEQEVFELDCIVNP